MAQNYPPASQRDWPESTSLWIAVLFASVAVFIATAYGLVLAISKLSDQPAPWLRKGLRLEQHKCDCWCTVAAVEVAAVWCVEVHMGGGQ